MTLYDTLIEFGGTVAVAAVFGFITGVLIIWLPKNVK